MQGIAGVNCLKESTGFPVFRCLMARDDDNPWFTEDVPGEYKELAEKVKRITGKVTSRVASRRAGVSHDTITRLWQGDRSTQATLIRFAIGYAVNPNDLLKVAGFPLLSEKAREQAERYRSPEIEEIERVFDPSDLPVVYSYSGLKDANKKAVETLIKQFEAAEKAESIGGKVAN